MAAALWAQRLMGRSLHAWSALLQRRREARIRGRCLTERWFVPRLHRRTLALWNLAAVAAMRCRTMKSRQSYRTLTAALKAWRSLAARELRLRHFHLRWQKRLGYIVASAWAREASESAGLRRRRARMERQQSIRTVSVTMRTWAQLARVSACIRRKTHHHDAQMMELALSSWRARCSELLWRRTRLEQRTERQHLVQAFSSWRHVIKIQNAVSLMWKTHRSALTRQSWLLWQLWACERMLGRQKLRGRAALRALGSAWNQWNWMLEAQKRLRIRWQSRDRDLLGSTFGHWRRCFTERRESVIRLTEQARLKSKQLIWITWQQRLQDISSLKVKLFSLHARWLLFRNFQQWHQLAHMWRKVSLLHAAAQLRLCNDVLLHWQAAGRSQAPGNERPEVPSKSGLQVTSVAALAYERGAEGGQTGSPGEMSMVTEDSPRRATDAVGPCVGGVGIQTESMLHDAAVALPDDTRNRTPDDATSPESKHRQSFVDDLRHGGSNTSSPSRRQQQERRKRSSSPTSPELTQLPPPRSSPTSPELVQPPLQPATPPRPLLTTLGKSSSPSPPCWAAAATPSPSPRPEDRARVAASPSPLRRSLPSRSPSPLVAIPSPVRSSPRADRRCSPAVQRSGPQVLPWAGSSQQCYFQPAPAWSLQGGEDEEEVKSAAEAEAHSPRALTSKAWSTWRSFWTLRRRRGQLSRHTSHRAAQRALVALRGLAQAKRCWKQGLLASTLACLRSAAEIARAQRTVLRQLLAGPSLPGRTLVQQAWVALLSVHEAWQEAQRLSTERQRHASLAGPCIWSWAQLAASARANREALSAKHSQNLVLRCLRGWQTCAQLAVSARANCEGIISARSSRRLASCTQAWQTWVQLAVSARADCVALVGRRSQTLSSYCLHGWQTLVQLASSARADAEARNAKCSRSLALRCLQAWRTWVQLAFSTRADREARISSNRSRHLASCCLRRWQTWVQLVKSLAGRSARQRSQSTVLRCVQGWHGLLCSGRHAANLLRILSTKMIQAKAWNAWLTLSRSLAAHCVALSQRRLGSRRAALRRWAAATAARRARRRTPPPREEELQLTPVKAEVPDRALPGVPAAPVPAAKVAFEEEDFVQQRMRQVKLMVADARIRGSQRARSTRNMLNAWRQLRVAEHMARRRSLRCCLQELRNSLLATSHAAEIHSQVRVQKRLRASLARWHGRSSSRAAAEWVSGLRARRAVADWALAWKVRLRISAHSEQSSQLRHLVWYWLSGLSVHVFEMMQAWSDAAKRARQGRLELQQLRLAKAALEPRSLKRSFAAWARRAALRRPRLALVARLRSSRQSAALDFWLQASRRVQAGRVLTAVAKRRDLRRAVDAWAIALSLRRQLHSVRAQRRTLLLRRAMDHWLVLQGRQRAGSEVQGRAQRWRIRKVLRRWSLALQAQSRAAAKGSLARAALQAAGMAAWRLAASSCVFRRRALRLAVRLWRAGVAAATQWLLRKAWSAWRREWRQSSGGQRLAQAAFHAWHGPVLIARRRRMRHAFASWRAARAAGILERRLLAECVLAIQEMVSVASATAATATVRRYLSAWRMARAACQAWRREASHGFKAWRCGLQVQQALGLQRCLRIWRGTALNRSLAVLALNSWRAAAMQLLSQALQRRLQRWRRAASLATAARSQVGLVLQAWKDAVAASCSKVMQRHLRLWNGLAVASVATRRSSQVLLQAWHAAARTSFERTLRQRLQLWRECSARHVVARGMMLAWSKLAREASSRALRCRLQLWRSEAARGSLVRTIIQVWRSSVAEFRAKKLRRCWHLWSAIAASQARTREIMKDWYTATANAQRKKLHCRLKLWSEAALRQKLARDVTRLWLFVVTVARRGLLRRCLRLWRGCAAVSMTSGAIAKATLAVWRLSAVAGRMHFLRLCVHTWRGIVAERDGCRSWAQFAFEKWRSFTNMQALRCWVRLWRSAMVQVSSCRDVARQLLDEWARVTVEKRILFMRRCLHLWRGNAAATNISRALARHLLQHWKSRTDVAHAQSLRCRLHVWRGSAAAARFVREVAKQLLLHWHETNSRARTRSLHQCFCLWRGSAAAASTVRSTTGKLFVQWKASTFAARAKCLRRGLFLWRGSAGSSKAHRAIANDFLLRWRTDVIQAHDERLRHALRMWRVKVDASMASNSIAKTCLQGWQLHTSAASTRKLRRRLHWWRCAARTQSVLREYSGLAICEWQGFVQQCHRQRVVCAWRRWSCLTACQARHRCLQGDIFRYWQRALLIARRALLRRSHGLWKRLARLAAQERCLLLLALGGLSEQAQLTRQARLRLAMTSWRTSRALARADGALAAAVLDRWRAAIEDRKKLEDELSHFWWCCERSNVLAAERLAGTGALVFREWASRARQQLAHRRRCGAAVQAARTWPMRAAFAAFREALAARGQRRHAAQLAAGLQRCLARPLRAAMTGWRDGRDDLLATDWQRHRAMRASLKAWQFIPVLRKRFQAAALILHQMPLSWGFAKLARARGCSKASLGAGGEGGLTRLRVLGAELLRGWRAAARKSLLSHWLLRWRAGTAVTLGSLRISCRGPLRRWHARATELRTMRKREFLARRYAARRFLQRVLGSWAMSKHSGQLRDSPLLAAPVLQSSWCSTMRGTRPDGLALWSSALRVAASCH